MKIIYIIKIPATFGSIRNENEGSWLSVRKNERPVIFVGAFVLIVIIFGLPKLPFFVLGEVNRFKVQNQIKTEF